MPLAIAAVPAAGVGEVDPDMVGDAPAPEAPEVPVPLPLPAPPAPPVEDEIMGDGLADEVWPPFLEGARLQVVPGRFDGRYSYHDRLQVVCTNPDHRRCRKSRSTVLSVAQLGHNAALCYLGAWLRAADRPEDEHRRYEPTMVEMREYRATLEDCSTAVG